MKPRPWDLTRPENFFGNSLENRVSELEKRICEVEGFLKLRFPRGYDKFLAELNTPKTQVRKRGPKPQVADDELFIRRHKLVWFLEQYWPELAKVISSRTSEASLRAKLNIFAESRFGPHAVHAKYLIDRMPFLLSFIRSEEYSGDPRQVANALAGVPENAWATSLKRCRAVPCERAIDERALRDYLRRNFSGVHAKLLNARDTDSVIKAMAETRTSDREFLWMRENPEFTLHIMRQGIPREL